MTMSAPTPSKEDLIQYLTFPVPNLKDVPRSGTLSREERLKIIITNLEKHQQAVRINIINDAKRKHENSLAVSNYNKNGAHKYDKQNPEQMDTSPDQPSRPAQEDGKAMSQLLASLNRPYHESLGDPCCTGPIQPPPDIRQKTPPPGFAAAKEAIAKIALYDSHALPAKKHYAEALKRIQGDGATGSSSVTDPRRTVSTSSGGSDGRRLSAGNAGASAAVVRPSYGRTHSGTLVSRPEDPRLAGRSASHQRLTPLMQSPITQSLAERPSDPGKRR